MSEPAIRVEGLWKEYVIGGSRTAGMTFRESVMEAVKAPLRRLTGHGAEVDHEERFWALKDVSFEVQPGEVVGIIGRNGAGKSTLLKILSRITAPTKGRIEIRGRVASLLEVGTGFHPELTGRENIRLNGAILGMSGAEIAKKFDEIVAFAGVERFIDTPAKRYSSGMQVRLAFAVAAHLDPEILIVDEVLAVGDADFQKKCMGKMGEIAGKGGRTVLFVSHNMGAVADLCMTGALIEYGHLTTKQEIDRTIALYMKTLRGGKTTNTKLGCADIDLKPMQESLFRNEPLHLKLTCRLTHDHELEELAIIVTNSQMIRIAVIDLRSPLAKLRPKRDFELNIEINTSSLIEDKYNFGLYAQIDSRKYQHDVRFTIAMHDRPREDGMLPYPAHVRGLMILESKIL